MKLGHRTITYTAYRRQAAAVNADCHYIGEVDFVVPGCRPEAVHVMGKSEVASQCM